MEQLNIFDIIDKVKIKHMEENRMEQLKELRVFEAFAGVGSQRMALRNLNIPHKVVGISEIDKFALASYEAIHGECPNYGDISKIEPHTLPDMDLFTYSFPCQDLSTAGLQKGMGHGTRSGLLYECKKVIEVKKPKYLLLENVKNLVGKKFKNEFDLWLEYLEGLGYKNYWKVLNAKNYGVPQNRERVFVVSILHGNTTYKFPPTIENTKRIKDILEKLPSNKFLASKKVQDRLKLIKKDVKTNGINVIGTTAPEFRTIGQVDQIYGVNGIIGCITASDYKYPKQILHYEFPQPQPLEKRIKDILQDEVDTKYYINKPFKLVNKGNEGLKQIAQLEMKGHDCIKRVYDPQGQAPTLTTMGGGNTEPKILIVGSNQPETSTSIGQRYNIYSENGLMGALVATDYKQPKQIMENYKVRKLTPLECWRLMGFTDEDFYKAEKVCSNSQLYKQAGNSIVVPVLEGIFKNLFL